MSESIVQNKTHNGVEYEYQHAEVQDFRPGDLIGHAPVGRIIESRLLGNTDSSSWHLSWEVLPEARGLVDQKPGEITEWHGARTCGDYRWRLAVYVIEEEHDDAA